MTRTVAFLSVLLAAVVVALLVVGVGRAGRHAGLATAFRRRLLGGVAAALAGWLAVVALAASLGVFSDFDARPPRLLLAPISAMLLLVFASRTATFRRLLSVVPLWWPIALHTMRVPIELGLWALHRDGLVPVQMTFEGRNLDVLVGLSAPVIALLVARGRLGGRGLLAWNVASLALLANIVGIAVTSMPGPLHLAWSGLAPIVLTTAPFVWLPGFFVPVALFGHLVSLGQLLRGGQVREARCVTSPAHVSTISRASSSLVRRASGPR